jgi:hypothetical protein
LLCEDTILLDFGRGAVEALVATEIATLAICLDGAIVVAAIKFDRRRMVEDSL